MFVQRLYLCRVQEARHSYSTKKVLNVHISHALELNPCANSMPVLCAFNELVIQWLVHADCRECVLSDLPPPPEERHQAKLEAMAREEEEQKIQAKAAARERVLMDFERKHMGLALTSQRTVQSKDATASGMTPTESETPSRTPSYLHVIV